MTLESNQEPNPPYRTPDLRSSLQKSLEMRAGALSWLKHVSTPLAVVWIDGNVASHREAQEIVRPADPPAFAWLLRASQAEEPALRRRATSALHDRVALHLASEHLGERPEVRRLLLTHTALGQPVVTTCGGLRAPDLHVSFSHDGAAHVCALARHGDLRGVGVDVVHLPRLRGRTAQYLYRFASHFMSAEEYDAFCTASQADSGEALMRRTAAHFSLMEAASKAFGTGLKIGAGMGKRESLPKQSIGISRLEPDVEFLVGGEARARCAELRASSLEGHWAADEEYGVSLVLLWA